MQRNAFSSEDAFSDAPMEEDVLDFVENQRLRSNSYEREKERYNYYIRKEEGTIFAFV